VRYIGLFFREWKTLTVTIFQSLTVVLLRFGSRFQVVHLKFHKKKVVHLNILELMKTIEVLIIDSTPFQNA
jgi:hypothetical protein